jgi:ABC-type transport system involved in cytochrome c biogenesis permease component
VSEPGPRFFAQVRAIVGKDLRIEWRSREVFATMTFLAVVVVLIFSFAFVVEGARPPAPVVAGILWVAVVVSGTVALSRAFDREREGEAIRSLLLSPAPRGAIYLGKLAATVCLMLVTETVLTGLCAILFATGVDEMLARVSAPSGSRPSAASSRRRCCARAAATRYSLRSSTRSSCRS